jgi:release factor glutamine methyltransferase
MFSLSWGRLRTILRPVVLKYWLNERTKKLVTTRVEGLNLEVYPGVFHPKYFGSSAILANFVSSLPLTGRSFLEIGCGSGVVSLCAARAGAEVIAIDINPQAVQCTLANAASNELRVQAHLGDLFSPISGARFDVIAWNPPFLPGEPRTPAEAAFYGGSDLGVIRRFTEEVREHLNPDASVYTILSADTNTQHIENLFRRQTLNVSTVVSKSWGLGETMVILCAR